MSRSSADDRLRALLEEYGHVLRRAIRRVAPGAPSQDQDDIEQEAKVRLWRAMERQIELERPASYLYRLAVNATLDAVKRSAARQEQPLDATAEHPTPPAASPERAAIGRQLAGSVEQAIARLLPDRRRAVGLHLQGFTTAEIADFYGWTEPKARNLAYRGLGDLRRHLEPQREHLEDLAAI